jgi:hypothetical protein
MRNGCGCACAWNYDRGCTHTISTHSRHIQSIHAVHQSPEAEEPSLNGISAGNVIE